MFCGKGPLTREHVLPKWLRRAMKLWGPLTIWNGAQPVRTARKLDIQVRAVCGPCNHGWLNDLETEFRDLMTPALHGLPVLLDRTGQNVVARWGIKTWLLLETAMSHQRGGGVASADTLAHIRKDSEPPWGYQIWLGQLDAQSRQIMWLSTVPIFGRQGDEIPIGVMAVFTVGNLLFLIYVPVKEPPFGLGIPDEFGPFLSQIWPIEAEEIRWPPRGMLRPSDLERLWPSNSTRVIPPTHDAPPASWSNVRSVEIEPVPPPDRPPPSARCSSNASATLSRGPCRSMHPTCIGRETMRRTRDGLDRTSWYEPGGRAGLPWCRGRRPRSGRWPAARG